MSDIVKRLDAVLDLRGDTFSSEEVFGILAAAKVEIERLRSDRDMARTYSGDLLAQNIKLLAEIERLKAAWDGKCPLCMDAEIERLHKALATHHNAYKVEIDRLCAEIAELREARRNLETRLNAELREAAGKYVAVVESGQRTTERLRAENAQMREQCIEITE
jgi:uncharacterized protein YukE